MKQRSKYLLPLACSESQDSLETKSVKQARQKPNYENYLTELKTHLASLNLYENRQRAEQEKEANKYLQDREFGN